MQDLAPARRPAGATPRLGRWYGAGTARCSGRDRRVFHPLGITSLNDFSALGEEALRRMAGRTLRRVTRRRWFGVGTFVHDLGEDEATLWRRVAARERTKCASAVRAGVTVDFADRPGDEKLREFLRLYDRLAIERALEMLSLEMLQTMFRGGHLTLARAVDREGRTLVANVVHRAHDHGYFLLGARGAGAAPGAGHLIHWETIRKLKGDGYRFYDLGSGHQPRFRGRDLPLQAIARRDVREFGGGIRVEFAAARGATGTAGDATDRVYAVDTCCRRRWRASQRG